MSEERAPRTLKISYAVESRVTLTAAAQEFLINTVRAAKLPDADLEKYPPGFIAAASKLGVDADDELILRTMIGEVTAGLIKTMMPRMYPGEDKGFKAVFSKISYQETPEKLDPPADAVPMLPSQV